MKRINVLVLGVDGMLGSVLYRYLKNIKFINCKGTSKTKSKESLLFNAKHADKSWKVLIKDNIKIDYVINCIALLKNYPDKRTINLKEYTVINTDFPHFLEKRSLIDNFRLIHISTDSVFSPNQRRVNEKSETNPQDEYDRSKLRGEVTGKNSLTIRTSIIGTDHRNHKGIIENIISSKGTYSGYTNQIWTGATTLQITKFIQWLIGKKGFSKITKHTHLIHYAPLGPFSKYHLVRNARDIFNINLKINKVKSASAVTRCLGSIYSYLLPKYLNDNNIVHEMKDLFNFDTMY